MAVLLTLVLVVALAADYVGERNNRIRSHRNSGGNDRRRPWVGHAAMVPRAWSWMRHSIYVQRGQWMNRGLRQRVSASIRVWRSSTSVLRKGDAEDLVRASRTLQKSFVNSGW